MRTANRIAALFLALVVAAVGVLIAVESVGLISGRVPVLVPWDRWYAAGSGVTVGDTAILVSGVVAVAVGLVILIGQLHRWRPVRLPSTTAGWFIRRRELEKRLVTSLNGLAGVSQATARLSGRWRLRVHVVADAEQTGAVERMASAELDRVGAPQQRRVSVSTRRPRRVV
ncbi:hypothetical protein [Stackebrandtia soli]|uniref:hypothetical protein n=1 Tax=Stackebrandtia soli TaxID=1892856 RepID=UPI0039ED0223